MNSINNRNHHGRGRRVGDPHGQEHGAHHKTWTDICVVIQLDS